MTADFVDPYTGDPRPESKAVHLAAIASQSAVVQAVQDLQSQIPPAVTLIAVSKQASVAAMRAAYGAGVRHFGESRVPEAIAKQAEMTDLPGITWHLIGHLQGNKAAKALEHFSWIHSVSSLKLALRLNQLASERPQPPNVLLQVKLLPDVNKFGWEPAALQADLPTLDQCAHLKIRGLMTIPPYGLTSEAALAVFQQLRSLATTIQQQPHSRITMEHLSMGMSEDYPLAIEAGATMVRLGRVIFGDRR